MKSRKITAWILAVVMIMSLVPVVSMPVSAADVPSSLNVAVSPAGIVTAGHNPTQPTGVAAFFALSDMALRDDIRTRFNTMNTIADIEERYDITFSKTRPFISVLEKDKFLIVVHAVGDFSRERLLGVGETSLTHVTFQGLPINLTSVTPAPTLTGNRTLDDEYLKKVGRTFDITLPYQTTAFVLGFGPTSTAATATGTSVTGNFPTGVTRTSFGLGVRTSVTFDLTTLGGSDISTGGTARVVLLVGDNEVAHTINITVKAQLSKPLFIDAADVALTPTPTSLSTWLNVGGPNAAGQAAEEINVRLNIPNSSKIELTTVANTTSGSSNDTLVSNQPSFVDIETGSAAKITVNMSHIPLEGGTVRFRISYTEGGQSDKPKATKHYNFTIVVAESIDLTDAVTFGATAGETKYEDKTPIADAKALNSQTGGNNTDVVFETLNGTGSIEFTLTGGSPSMTSSQRLDKGGLHAANVSFGTGWANGKITVNIPRLIRQRGGEVDFTLTLSQTNFLDRTYNVKIIVAGMDFEQQASQSSIGVTATGRIDRVDGNVVWVDLTGTPTKSGVVSVTLSSDKLDVAGGSIIPASRTSIVTNGVALVDTSLRFTVMHPDVTIDDLVVDFEEFDDLADRSLEDINKAAETNTWRDIEIKTFVDAGFDGIVEITSAQADAFDRIKDALTAAWDVKKADLDDSEILNIILALESELVILALINQGRSEGYKDVTVALFGMASITSVNADNRDAVVAKMIAANKVFTLTELHNIVKGIQDALRDINDAAATTGTWDGFRVTRFADAGVNGVTSANFEAVRAAMDFYTGNSPYTIAELQNVVDGVRTLGGLASFIGSVVEIDYLGMTADRDSLKPAKAREALNDIIDDFNRSTGIFGKVEVSLLETDSVTVDPTTTMMRYTVTLTAENDAGAKVAERSIIFNIVEKAPTDPFDIVAFDTDALIAFQPFIIPVLNQTDLTTMRAYLNLAVNSVTTSGTVATVTLTADNESEGTFSVHLKNGEAETANAIILNFEKAFDGIIAKEALVASPANGATGATINVDTGRLVLDEGYRYAAFSLDGGARWRNGTIRNNDLSKMFNKGVTLHLSDKPVERANNNQPAEDAVIIRFPAIAARPKIRLQVFVNFFELRDITGATPGAWTLSSDKNAFVAIQGVEIARDLGKKQIGEWGTVGAEGIPVADIGLAANGKQKATKMTYYVRIPGDDSSETIIPPGAMRKINVSGLTKAPSFKYNARKGIVAARDTATFTVNGSEARQAEKEVEAMTGDRFEFWVTATARKPASAKQTLVIN